MNIPVSARAPGLTAHDGPDSLRLALILSFACTGLGQFLRTPPAQLAGQAGHWVTVSLMTLPLFAIGVWGGDWVAGRAGLGTTLPDIIKRALITAFLAALALMPVWLEVNKVDRLARMQSLITPGSHGYVDVYWVSSGVITALLYVCLVPAAAWAGRGMAGRIRLRGKAGTVARGAVVVVMLAAVPAAARLLNQAAQHAYASQVNYTSATLSAHAQSHVFTGRARKGAPVTAAPFAFAYQAAHALQDGLAGQAAGLPVIAASLLLAARRASGRGQYQQSASN